MIITMMMLLDVIPLCDQTDLYCLILPLYFMSLKYDVMKLDKTWKQIGPSYNTIVHEGGQGSFCTP